jgi:hypothetical protein
MSLSIRTCSYMNVNTVGKSFSSVLYIRALLYIANRDSNNPLGCLRVTAYVGASFHQVPRSIFFHPRSMCYEFRIWLWPSQELFDLVAVRIKLQGLHFESSFHELRSYCRYTWLKKSIRYSYFLKPINRDWDKPAAAMEWTKKNLEGSIQKNIKVLKRTKRT